MLDMKIINTENWFKSLPVSHCFGESNVVRVVNNKLHLYLNELDYCTCDAIAFERRFPGITTVFPLSNSESLASE